MTMYIDDIPSPKPESWPALLRFANGFGDRLHAALLSMPNESGRGAIMAGRWCSAAVEFTIDEATWKKLRALASGFPSPLAMLRSDTFIRDVARCLSEVFPREEDNLMLPEVGERVSDDISNPLHLVRVLEEFEGAILSEYKSLLGHEHFLEKYCTEKNGITRWLVVCTEQASVDEYLAGKLSLRDLLFRHETLAMLVDRRAGAVVARRMSRLADIPAKYLPGDHVFHDPELRPAGPEQGCLFP